MRYFISDHLYKTLISTQYDTDEYGRYTDKIYSTVYDATVDLLTHDKQYSDIMNIIGYTTVLNYTYIPDIYVYSRFLEADMLYYIEHNKYIKWDSWQFSHKALHYIIKYYPELVLYDDRGDYDDHLFDIHYTLYIHIHMSYITYALKYYGIHGVNWEIISRSYKLINSFIIEYKHYLHWDKLQNSIYDNFSEGVLDKCDGYIDWKRVSLCTNLESITDYIMNKYRNELDFKILDGRIPAEKKSPMFYRIYPNRL